MWWFLKIATFLEAKSRPEDSAVRRKKSEINRSSKIKSLSLWMLDTASRDFHLRRPVHTDRPCEKDDETLSRKRNTRCGWMHCFAEHPMSCSKNDFLSFKENDWMYHGGCSLMSTQSSLTILYYARWLSFSWTIGRLNRLGLRVETGISKYVICSRSWITMARSKSDRYGLQRFQETEETNFEAEEAKLELRSVFLDRDMY